MKATAVAGHQGRTPWTDALRPGRTPDTTAARNESIPPCLHHFRDAEVLLDDRRPGLRHNHPGQAVTPPRKANKISPPEVPDARPQPRHQHPSKRITVEHAPADHKRWKQPIHQTHRRENPPATYRANAGPDSNRNT
ncbi:transposase (plasmid) [Streptomyces sp. NBC_01497]